MSVFCACKKRQLCVQRKCVFVRNGTHWSISQRQRRWRNWKKLTFLNKLYWGCGSVFAFYHFFFYSAFVRLKEKPSGGKKSPYGSREVLAGVWVAGVCVWEWEPEAPFPAAILTFLFFLYLPLFCGSSFSFHRSYGCWFCRLLVFERLLSMNLRARKRLRGEKDV